MSPKYMKPNEEAARCLLCENAPCTAACDKGCDPARGVRAVRFENEKGAGAFMKSCKECEAPCEKACIHYDAPIRIKKIAESISDSSKNGCGDLSIDFCGVHCENPFFLSSSVIAGGYDMIAKAFDMGWAGVAYKTIGFFIPEEVSPRFDAVGKEGTPFVGFRNMEQISDHSLEENLAVIKKLKEDYPDKVIISSIMGMNEDEWTELARLSEEAGADMIECNFSCPQMSVSGMGCDVGQDTELVRKYTEATRKGTKLPILAKMTPNLARMEPPAEAAVQGGADCITAINTVKSLTISDNAKVSDKFTVSGYSGKAVKPIALRFISDIARDKALSGVEISGTGGIETWKDALEFIQLGCSNIQITTAVMQYGYRIIDDLIDGFSRYMSENGIKKVSDIVGSISASVDDTDKLDRATVVFPKVDREKCTGCGRCYVSCYDGGHQAITFGSDRVPKINGSMCVGCHLCRLVCPVGAIGTAKRIPKK